MSIELHANGHDVSTTHKQQSNNKHKMRSILHEFFRKDDAKSTISFLDLYKYASTSALSYTILGTVASLLNSTLMPLMFVIYGDTTDQFVNDQICQLLDYVNISSICPPYVDISNFNEEYFRCNLSSIGVEIPTHNLIDRVSQQCLYFTLIGLATLFFSGIQIAAFTHASNLIVLEVRRQLMLRTMFFPIEWFDSNDSGGLITSYLIEYMNKFRNGVGDKIGLIIQSLGTCITALVIGIMKGWKLSLVMIAASPPIVLSSALATVVTVRSTNAETKAYAFAGSVAQQAIRYIRTVQAFNGQATMIKKYVTFLNNAKKEGIRKATVNGIMLSTLWFVIFGTYALGFWYGSRLIRTGEFTIGALLAVFLGMQSSIFTLGNALPHLTAANEAKSAAFEIYKILEETSEDEKQANSKIGKEIMTIPATAETCAGDIVFKNVTFTYPSRREVKVLHDFSLCIPEGKITALVGESGCGKSTIVQLLLRYYCQDNGTISIGATDINQFDVHSFRRNIGLVGQEPVLFSATIAENIRMGYENATDDEIKEACRKANAEEFVASLPSAYETMVGESGSTLSGGQKQRLAIARALIANPRILLLDEATSALDSESERYIQETLETASKGRTTVVIAHRLSTLRNADLIVCLANGKVVEKGNHDELMAKDDGIYRRLVNLNSQQNNDDPIREVDIKKEKRIYRKSTIQSDHSAVNSPAVNNDAMSDSIGAHDEEKSSESSVLKFMFKMNQAEIMFIITGCICCAGFGLMQTLFELYFAEIVVLFSNCDRELRENGINHICILFLVFAIMSMISQILSSFCFGVSGENLTMKLRSAMFELLMRNDIAFFDQDVNSVGRLCTMLSSEASSVHGATGIRVGVVLSNFCILGTGILMSLIYGWELALVISAFMPLIIISGLLSIKLMAKYDAVEKMYLANAGRVAVEACSSIRTVKQLNLERHFSDTYNSIIETAFKKNKTKCLLNGILFGFSQAVIYFTLATGYYAGVHFVSMHRMTTLNMMIVFAGMLFASMAVGQNQAMAPEHGKSRAAAINIHKILTIKPKLDSMSDEGQKLENFDGEIHFQNVSFHYPTREESTVLDRLNLKMKIKSNIALVGTSGSGKSTMLQLLERYYAPTMGDILVGGVELSKLNVQWYRSQLGFVGQEPILFDWSIAENIAFGDTSREVIPIDELRFAANLANADDFICNLPFGYDTKVGSKGALISGGQKQRICIARSLIRNPKLLLLDEATSALDAESERLVQEALEDARKERGSVTVAHKLKTIECSDEIHVMNRGKIIESGRHEDLLAREEMYADLYHLSSR